MKRILDFATSSQLTLQLAYYPPFHSKDNPIERFLGWLEQQWNGSLIDTVETVVNFAKSLTFKGKNPVVTLVETIYSTGVTLNKLAMAEIETQINRLPNLQKWFVEIFALTHIAVGSFFLWRSLSFLKCVKNGMASSPEAYRAVKKLSELLNPNAAGMDIGSGEHWICVPPDRTQQNVRRFGCFTPDSIEMAQRLIECRVDTVAMESTGVYWIRAFQILEAQGIEVKLVNAHHVKTVPGRKSDVLDCQWLQQLHTYGLLSGS